MNTQAKYRSTKEYLLVYTELITAARYRGTVTYQEIAQIMGLPLTGSNMGREVGLILGQISEDEVQNGRPLLSAIAVNVSDQASEGFYKLARSLGKLQSDVKEQEVIFWEKERKAVYDTWRVSLHSRT